MRTPQQVAASEDRRATIAATEKYRDAQLAIAKARLAAQLQHQRAVEAKGTKDADEERDWKEYQASFNRHEAQYNAQVKEWENANPEVKLGGKGDTPPPKYTPPDDYATWRAKKRGPGGMVWIKPPDGGIPKPATPEQAAEAIRKGAKVVPAP